ncbi:MAG TPA: GNAT family N-acetyltransferase [Planctomycetaceae bacterium]
MSDDLTIRPAADADLAAVTAIYADHVLRGTGTFELTPPDEAEMTSRFAAIRGRGQPWLVAERAGEVLGYAYAGPFRTRPAYDWIVEDSIYIRADHRGQGIGAALLAELLDRCTGLGYRQMVALIGDSANLGSIRLHERFGFARVGLLAAVGWKHGRWLDVVLMQRPLGVGDSEGAGRRPSHPV